MKFKIYPNVKIGEGTKIEEYCILGKPPKGKKEGELKLIIGPNSLIRSHTIIYAGNKIGKNFQTGHRVVIRENNIIGDNVSIGTGATLEFGNIIGNNVRIQTQATIGELVKIEDDVWIGPRVIFLNDPHPPCPRYKECLGGPVIKRGAKIGANATILPGVVIGEYAIVGAGTVVTKDVEARTVVVGNPAKPIKKVDELKCIKGLYRKPYEWERK